MDPLSRATDGTEATFEGAPTGAKVLAITTSGALSIVYCATTMSIFLPDRAQVLAILLSVTVGTGLGIALIGALDLVFRYNNSGKEFANTFRAGHSNAWRYLSWLRQGAVYIATVWYVGLLAWVCIITGGVESPYTVILLTIATLSPFITKERRPKFIGLGLVVLTYFGVWGFYVATGRDDPKAPNPILAATSVAAIVIAVLLDILTGYFSGKGIDDGAE